MSTDWPWLAKLNTYVKDAIQVHHDDLSVARVARRFYKWWLELVRNVLAVSALYFLAMKSESLFLQAVAIFTCFILLGYFISWQNTFSVRFFPYIKNPRVNFVTNGFIWIALMIVLSTSLILTCAGAFATLSKLALK
jgi:hypothetical protein